MSKASAGTRFRRTKCLCGAAALAGAAWIAVPAVAVAASVPWTPSIAGRHAVELLVDDAGMDVPVSQWPLPRDAVQHALDALPSDLPENLAAARDRVQSELHAQQGSRVTLLVREHADAMSGFGDDATPGSSFQLRSAELDGPHVAFQIGSRLETRSEPAHSGRTVRLDDSAVATDAFGFQLQAWAHRSWWSPGWQNALPLSNNAPALDGVGFQRASASTSESPWLSWLGPWNVDFFVARSEGEATAPGANPLLSGARMTLRPFSHLEIGLTRMAQWGGNGRRETFRSFADIMLGLHTNADTVAQQASDPGNELAGYDVRVRCPDGVRCAVYGQFIGEDGAGSLPTKFLNMLGTEIWSADGVDRFFVEGTETSCRDSWKGAPIRGCAYRNYAYPGGFTTAGRWLGDSAVRFNIGHIGSRIGTYSPQLDDPTSSGHLIGISARRTFTLGAASVTPELDWNRVSAATRARDETRIGVEMSVGLDDMTSGATARLGDMLSGARSSPATQALTAAALIGGATLFDRPAARFANDHQHDPATKSLHSVGDVLPYAEFGMAGVTWLSMRGTTPGDTAFASLEAGLSAVALAEAIKLPIDRSRPSTGRGPTDFGHERRSDSSFPSVHSALAWSVLTPVAEQYDAPWLYGVAAVTNFARVAGRDHWFSDTVAGAVLGWWVGDWFQQRSDAKGDVASRANVMLMPHGVAVSLPFP
jgi:membrane-associated phospholipid phosphatase